MSEQEKDLQADIDYFIQEQATNALLNQTSFIENLSVQSNLFEQLKSQFLMRCWMMRRLMVWPLKKLNNG